MLYTHWIENKTSNLLAKESEKNKEENTIVLDKPICHSDFIDNLNTLFLSSMLKVFLLGRCTISQINTHTYRHSQRHFDYDFSYCSIAG